MIVNAGKIQKPGAISIATMPRFSVGKLRVCIWGWLRMNTSAPVLVITTLPEAAERAQRHYSTVMRALIKPITARELIDATTYALESKSHHAH